MAKALLWPRLCYGQGFAMAKALLCPRLCYGQGFAMANALLMRSRPDFVEHRLAHAEQRLAKHARGHRAGTNRAMCSSGRHGG